MTSINPLTEEEIHAACDRLAHRLDTDRPTLDQVYEEVGRRGSRTTISKYRRSWLEQHQERLADDPLLERSFAGLKQFHEEVRRELEASFAARAQALKAEIEQRDQAMGELEDQLEETREARDQALQRVTALEHDVRRLSEERQDAHDTIERQAQALRDHETTLAARDAEIARLAKAAAEHRDIQLATAKAMEGLGTRLEAHTDAVAGQQRSIQSLSETLDNAQARHAKAGAKQARQLAAIEGALAEGAARHEQSQAALAALTDQVEAFGGHAVSQEQLDQALAASSRSVAQSIEAAHQNHQAQLQALLRAALDGQAALARRLDALERRLEALSDGQGDSS